MATEPIDHGTLPKLVEAGAVRGACEAAACDAWFREQVQVSIDDPLPSVPDDEARSQFATLKIALRQGAR